MADGDLDWVLDAVLTGTDVRGDCVYIGGSAARGWANPGSDIDVYVLGAAADALVDTEPPGRPRVDVHALTAATVDRLYASFSWDVVREHQDYVDTRTHREWLLLERLHHAYPLAGAEALAGYQERLAGTAYRHMLVQEHFAFADAYAEDCLGQLSIGDDDSAVLSAWTARLRAVDGLLAARGMYTYNAKWRARAMQDAQPDLLPYEEFWRAVTMADLPAQGQRAWARGQIAATRELMARVDVLDFPA